jgi:hypothetical protein
MFLCSQNCYIFGFTNNGIDITTPGQVIVEGTTVTNNSQSGLSVQSTATTSVAIDRSHFDLNTFGVLAGSFSLVTVSESTASGNAQVGFIASAGSGTAELNVSNSTATTVPGSRSVRLAQLNRSATTSTRVVAHQPHRTSHYSKRISGSTRDSILGHDPVTQDRAQGSLIRQLKISSPPSASLL